MQNILVRVMAFMAVVLMVVPSDATVMKKSTTKRKAYESDNMETELGVGQGYSVSCDDSMMGYPASAMVMPTAIEDYTLSISASFLWWNINQEGMELAHIISDSGATDTVLNQKVKYAPGFKVMLGGYLFQDGWMGSVTYTRIQNVSKSVFTAGTSTEPLYAISGWIHPDYIQNDASLNDNGPPRVVGFTGDDVNSASLRGGFNSDWDTKLDKIDFCISRPYYCGTSLTISPYMGICLAWIAQDIQITASLDGTSTTTVTNTTTTSDLSTQSWLVGPMMCCECGWNLGYGIRCTGSFAWSLFFQNFDVNLDYATGDTASTSTEGESALVAVTGTSGTAATAMRAIANPRTINVRNKIDNVTIHYMGSVGLGWGAYVFEDDACNVDLTLCYEYNRWFGQNSIRKVASESRQVNGFAGARAIASAATSFSMSNVSNHPTYAGDLKYHGITLTLCVSF